MLERMLDFQLPVRACRDPRVVPCVDEPVTLQRSEVYQQPLEDVRVPVAVTDE